MVRDVRILLEAIAPLESSLEGRKLLVLREKLSTLRHLLAEVRDMNDQLDVARTQRIVWDLHSHY